MRKNNRSVKHAKEILKNLDKPFCHCLLKYIDELETEIEARIKEILGE